MNNQVRQTKLPTNRSFGVFMLRGVCSFAILALLDMWQMQCDLNTILQSHTSEKANFMFFGRRSFRLMNQEMMNRGINYKVNEFLPVYWSAITALNLLSEDYNRCGR